MGGREGGIDGERERGGWRVLQRGDGGGVLRMKKLNGCISYI